MNTIKISDISDKVDELKLKGYTQAQAVAIALEIARRALKEGSCASKE